MQLLPGVFERLNQTLSPLEKELGFNKESASGRFSDMLSEFSFSKQSVTESLDQDWSVSELPESKFDPAESPTPEISDRQERMAESGNLKVTREDFSGLREDLEKMGLEQEDLDYLEERVTSDEGITWKEFSSEIKDRLGLKKAQGESQVLSNEEKRDLTNFFEKIGFTPQEAEQLISDLGDGKLQSVWSALSEKLAALDPDETISINLDEIKALTKVLNLSDKDGQKLARLFEGGELELSPEGANKVLGMLKQGSLKAEKADERKEEKVDRTLDLALRKALDKLDREEDANAKQSVENRAVKETIVRDSENSDKAAKERTSSPADTIKERVQDGPREKVQSSEREAEAMTRRADTEKKDVNFRAEDKGNQGQAAGKEGSDSKGAGRNPDHLSESEKGWEKFFEKVEVRGTQKSEAQIAQAKVQTAAAKTDSVQQPKTDSLFRNRLMKSVESGVLRNLGQGRRSLTLRLDPPNLGKLSVILQVKNNEVQALIKTENQEVSRIIGDQLGQLKASLEQQGLKVQKLDVQTQLSQENSGQEWLGTGKHNQAWEQGERAKERSSMRYLLSNGESNEKAQADSGPPPLPADQSQGLDIIA